LTVSDTQTSYSHLFRIPRGEPLKIVLRIGGSVLGFPPEPSIVKEYSEVVGKIRKQGHSVAVVVGGGELSRKYIASAKLIGLPDYQQDWIAINSSRLNAKLVAMKLGVPGSIPTTVETVIGRLKSKGIAVMGGLKPGITTDTVASIIADKWDADYLIKASDQSAIYTKDPRLDSNAKMLESASYHTVKKILGGKHTPGIHSIVDPVAVQYLSERGTKLIVLNGKHPENVLKAVRGEKVGTLVT
jgi:uridylate kinase